MRTNSLNPNTKRSWTRDCKRPDAAPLTLSLSPRRLCRNEGIGVFVILNEVKNLMISTESIIEILRLSPQNDITTQSLKGEGLKITGLKDKIQGAGTL